MWRLYAFLVSKAPSEFNGGLIGFSAGVTEEHVLHASHAPELLGDRLLQINAKEVRGVNKPLRLFDYRGRDLRMLMPQIRHGDP